MDDLGKMTVPNIAANREGAGLLLRPFEERDAAEFAQAVRESVESVGPWMPWCHAEYSQTDALEWFKTCHHDAAAGTAYEYGVFSKDGNEFLGGAGLNLIVKQHGYCNLGYWVRQSQQRRGVASACVAVLSEVGFRELKLHRIEIVVAVGNEPSAGVARKAGATLECIARNRLLLKGKPVDASVSCASEMCGLSYSLSLAVASPASACRFTRRSAGKPEIRFFRKYKNARATVREGV